MSKHFQYPLIQIVDGQFLSSNSIWIMAVEEAYNVNNILYLGSGHIYGIDGDDDENSTIYKEIYNRLINAILGDINAIQWWIMTTSLIGAFIITVIFLKIYDCRI
ncbi:hypothetical protein RIR_jg36344.t1 [Rhizophagus irregularis DAOM 181602=DAOM 197198]|nr:hypothetical protein RIR_jg36344.t1 [Rhizophagus irregularis DAOM 181602=DAOM 197198]